MYTEKEWNAATKIIGQIAQEHHVPEEQVRSDMEEAINAGRIHPNPAVQAWWATFRFSGKEPTVEEFILWAAAIIRDMTS